MAISIDQTLDTSSDDIWGRTRVRNGSVTMDNSYPTGGESFTPANIGLAELFVLHMEVDANGAAGRGRIPQYDYTARTIKVYEEEAVAAGGGLVEVPNGTDLSTMVIRFTALGR